MILNNTVVESESMPTCPLQILAMNSPTMSASLKRFLESGSRNDGVSSAVARISCYGDAWHEGGEEMYMHTGWKRQVDFDTGTPLTRRQRFINICSK